MNFKTTYILFGILLVLIGVVAVALWYDPSARNDTSKFVLPALHEKDAIKAEDIDHVEIERPDKDKIVLEREPSSDRWTIVEPKKLRADKIAVSHLISQIFDAAREDKVGTPASLSAWGLEPPEGTITLKKGTDRPYTLLVGKVSPGADDAVIYVLDPTRRKDPMAVKKSRLDAVLTPLDDFRDTELLASAVGDVQSISLSKGKDTVAWKKDDKGHWLYTDPKSYGETESGFEDAAAPADGKIKAPGSINTVLTDLTNIKVEKIDKKAEFIDDVKDFAKYGLDPSKDDVFEITITKLEETGKDGSGKIKTKPVSLTLLIGKKADDKGEKYYARLKGETTVVKVSAKNIDPLTKLLLDKEALRDRNLVHMEGLPSAVNIKNAYGLIELRRTKGASQFEPESWKWWRDENTSQDVDSTVMQSPQSLVSLLRQKNLIDGFIERKEKKEDQAKQESELGFDKAEIVELWDDEDGVKKAEPPEPAKAGDKPKTEKPKKPELKSKDPTYRLTFGNPVHEHDKDLVNVKREVKRKDGGYDVTLVQIPRLALDEAKKGPLAYLSKTLEQFAEAGSGLPPWKGVTKVVIQRGKTTLAATREKDDAPWKIVKPEELAGRNAETAKIDAVLGAMNRLTATRLVAEKAKDDAELESAYGLKAPQTKVEITITKDGKPVTYAYDFGNDTKGEVYAKQSQRPMIFTVDKGVLSGLPTDILDPVVFKFDPEKVKKVTLTGWGSFSGTPVTLEFEKKDKKWEVTKGPKDFKLDDAKLTKLLDDLRESRAVRFEAFKVNDKSKYDFAPEKDGLVVEITVEGDAKPITLTVGKLDGDKGYFAMSDRTGGDVFVLRKDIFDGPKSKPKYFSP